MQFGKGVRRGAAAALVAGSLGAWAWASEAPAPIPFTAVQADRGHELYGATCAACHGGKLEGTFGGPPLKTAAFRARWDVQSGEALVRFVRERMPPSAAGSLSQAEAADLAALILQANGAAAGPVPLPADPAALAATSLAATLPALPRRVQSLPPGLGTPPPKPDATAQAAFQARAQRLARLRPVTDEMLRHPPDGAWLQWRRTYDGQGFSPLKQIARANVRTLQLAWSWKLASSPNEITPLVHDGVMFVASGGQVQALDAASGDQLWRYDRRGAAGAVRNLAIYGERLYYASPDAWLTALDMRTGQVAWERRLAAPDDHLRFTGGPLAIRGKVIQGMSGCHVAYPGGCFIVALDAETGREAWRFYTLPRPGQPGAETWNGAAVDDRVGGSVWTTGSYDPDLDLAYFGVGQTYRITTLLRGGDGSPHSTDALYTDSTLAIRPDTGELVWHYQHLARDVWDLDWAFERLLITRTVDGRPRKTVTTAGKLGIFDTLDAATGQYLGSYDPGLQTVVSAIDPKTGAKAISPKAEPEAGVEKLVCPSGFGHRNWPATAYDPQTGLIYAPLWDGCMPYTWVEDPRSDFQMKILPIPRPGSDGQQGEMRAIDPAAGKTVWMQRRRAAQASAILATAGGLVFEGSRDRWFRASSARTGKVLWQVRLDSAPYGYPIAYSVDGVQYVAITTGGGNSLDTFVGKLTPEITTPEAGVTLWVFRLPERGGK